MAQFVQLLMAIVQILPIVPPIIECFTDDESDLVETHKEEVTQVIELCTALGEVLQDLKKASERQCNDVPAEE